MLHTINQLQDILKLDVKEVELFVAIENVCYLVGWVNPNTYGIAYYDENGIVKYASATQDTKFYSISLN